MSQDQLPEILIDLADQIGERLAAINPDIKNPVDIGIKVADHIAHHWGGQSLYIPKNLHSKLSNRNQEIWSEYNGRNTKHLCKKFKLSEQRIYQILSAIRAQKFKRNHTNKQ